MIIEIVYLDKIIVFRTAFIHISTKKIKLLLESAGFQWKMFTMRLRYILACFEKSVLIFNTLKWLFIVQTKLNGRCLLKS